MERLYNEVKRIIEDEENPKSFCEDLFKHGCVSGMVSELIYYKDTNKFYDKFEEEIEELIEEQSKELGFDNRLEFISSLNGTVNGATTTTEKNLLAWFSFEEVAYIYYVEELEEEL